MKWILIMSIVGFLLMGYDKSKAINGKYRIPEITLFSVAIIGGAPGIGLGMLVFWHKVRKGYFVIGIPLLIYLNYRLALYKLPTETKNKKE